MKDTIFYTSVDPAFIAASGFSTEHRCILSEIAVDMLEEGISEAQIRDDAPLRGRVMTRFEWANAGVLGGYRFYAFVRFEGTGDELVEIEFLIVPVGLEPDAEALKMYRRMACTDVSVN